MLAKRIQGARKAAGLTQAALAEKTGLSRIYVTLIEQGERHNPSLAHVRALAAALGCKAGDLVDNEANFANNPATTR